MNLDKKNLTELLTIHGKTFIIPSFQRPYKWEEENWNDLFWDIIRIYEKETEHFMGAIVIQEKSNFENSAIIIDGQQRLTTISLCLLAFAQWIKANNSGNIYLYNNTIKEYLITNNKFDGSEIKRIKLSNKHDNDKFYKMVIDSFYNPNNLNNILNTENNVFIDVCKYFYNEIEAYYYQNREKIELDEFVSNLFSSICHNLRFITISLDKNEDANMIFETLNTRGKALEHGELIRNYIFMHPNISNPDEIYEKYWEPLEKYFEDVEEKKISNFSDFLRFFLYANKYDSRIIKNSHIYLEMKDYLNEFLEMHNVMELLEKIHEYKKYFSYIINPENIPKNFFSDRIITYLNLLKYMNTFVYTSILLKLFELYCCNRLSLRVLENIIGVVTSYSVRLSLAGKKLPNKIIPEIILAISNAVEEETIIEDIENIISRQKSSPFYNDNIFKKFILENEIYSTKKKDFIKYLLLLVYNNESKNRLSYNKIEGLTIEHIFPQSNENWRKELGELELERSNSLLNTLGNLTLVSQSLNSKLSNSGFAIKKKELEKYSIWPFERGEFFNDDAKVWDSTTIIYRGSILAEYVIQVLTGPSKNIYKPIKENELIIKVNNCVIEGKNQKDIYIKSIQKMYEICNKDKWNRLSIKGCAAYDRTLFTSHQKEHLIKLGNVYFNYHASLREKLRRLKNIAQFCNIELTIK